MSELCVRELCVCERRERESSESSESSERERESCVQVSCGGRRREAECTTKNKNPVQRGEIKTRPGLQLMNLLLLPEVFQAPSTLLKELGLRHGRPLPAALGPWI